MSETLKQGSRGDAVTNLQNKLNQLGYQVGVDGVFGEETKNAVEELQTAWGYDIDGIVGKGTHGLIDAQVGHGWKADAAGIAHALKSQGKTTAKGSVAGADLKRSLKAGQAGGDVSYLQRRLVALGYGIVPTGTFDAATEKSVKELQTAFGYDVDGIVGPGTHKLINAQIGYGWKAGSGAKSDADVIAAKEAAAKAAPAKALSPKEQKAAKDAAAAKNRK